MGGVLKLGILLVGVFIISGANATFNLWLNHEEVKRILGLSNELYYVREGVVNEYGLKFVVPVPDNVNALHFTWQTLGTKPLPYSASIEISDPLAMDKPSLNISQKGLIPTVPQTFHVSLPCTGHRTAEVNFELVLNVTAYPKFRANEVTTITLRRMKICREELPGSKPKAVHRKNKDHSQKTNKPSFQDGHLVAIEKSGNGQPDVVVISTEEAVTNKSSFIFLILACSLGFLLILLAMAFAAFVRTRKGRRNSGISGCAESNGFLHVDTSGNGSSGSGSGTGTGSASGGSLFVRPESPHHYSSVSPCPELGCYAYSTFLPNPYQHYAEISTASDRDSLGNSKLAEMKIERCKVRLQSVIMEGTFAKIYKGTVMERDGSEEKVIVKTVVDHSSPVQMALLLHEGLALVGLTQKHVYSVIGVAAEERVPPFVIYPDDGFRNLKRFLQRCRSGPGRPITAQEIVQMAIQIGSGIAFLHRQSVCHRDVATRNCMIADDKMVVKISDAALSRDLFPDDYQWTGEAESRPIKWLPPEGILQCRTSTSADMWSFGVLIWELATLAQQPYADIETPDLYSFLKMGYRLSQPINCPDELYSSMTCCWTWDGDDRPKWTHVLPELQSLQAQLAEYV